VTWVTDTPFCTQIWRVFTSDQTVLARDVIYTSRAYATMSVSVCLSVCTEVHCRIIANLGFKFRSKFTRSRQCARIVQSRCMPGRGEGSSRAMLANDKPSCTCYPQKFIQKFKQECAIGLPAYTPQPQSITYPWPVPIFQLLHRIGG